jgi:hypothetical protein
MDFGQFLWSLLIIFFMICYFMILFNVIIDLFRNHDMNGFVKAIWIIALILIGPLALLIYVIAYHKGMQERAMAQAQANQQAQQAYIKTMAGTSTAADQIATANSLLASGAITQAEYDAIKKQALASA